MSGDTLNVYSTDVAILDFYIERHMTLTVGLLDYPTVTPISQSFTAFATSTCEVASLQIL